MTAVDVVVIGGGLQGLVLLRELTAAGYSCLLVTNAELGAGQTLHSHGLLESGTGLLTGGLRREIESTLSYLGAAGVPVHGEDRSFLLLPPPVAEQLAPVWEANGYRPDAVERDVLPPGFEPAGVPYRVAGHNVDKRRLVNALVAGLEHLVVKGVLTAARDGVQVRAAASGEEVVLRPRAVVLAAGCGTKRLLRDVFALEGSPQLERISYTKPHMVCLRGPAELLPEVGAVLSPELIVVGHADDGSGRRSVTWYVTPMVAAPRRAADAPDDAAGEVEPAVVAAAVEALLRLVPSLHRTGNGVQAAVFAGYKQDVDETPVARMCELVDGDRNIVVALPSVLANALPNAVDTLAILRRRVAPSGGEPASAPGGGARVGELPERTGHVSWSALSDFALAHGVRTG